MKIKNKLSNIDVYKLLVSYLKKNPKVCSRYMAVYEKCLIQSISYINKALSHYIMLGDFENKRNQANQVNQVNQVELLNQLFNSTSCLNLEKSSMKFLPKKCDFRKKGATHSCYS